MQNKPRFSINFVRVAVISSSAFLTILFCGIVGYFWYSYGALRYDRAAGREGIAILDKALQLTRDSLIAAQGENKSLTIQNSDLADNLRNQQNANNQLQYSIQTQINEISGTVGSLQKLSKTDPQLLAKYSKVYFLNENYVPQSLSQIDAQYLFDSKKPQQFLTNALPFLNNMLQAATNDKIVLKIVSGYRSYSEQIAVKTSHVMVYGSGANRFSADQGYSEHQLGTTADLITSGMTSLTSKMESSAAYKWLNENAYKYGFILSYPKSNSYYIFEPWHWRFVGVALATELHNKNQYFYEMTQRDINSYLIKIFDP